ncbi:phage head morphogenesis protein [Paeniglutamicibacter gangotriensis]|uniref:Phage head morphogenesis protein n=1 Tax=Paeniglutamicibacter gangotriensis TaxID=254787 RepID=A0A5B0EN92_9MICC|nr:phage minor head protein [Paeniglutamicibacter gangotriensis]KAA0979892.1 phage head morphogenesis protein [Paeniglutamicibacter gangotriensis]
MAVTDETLRLIADSRRTLSQLTDQQARALVGAWVASWDELLPEYEASIAELLEDAVDGKVSAAKVRANSRLRQALEVTRANLDGLQDAANVTITTDLPEVINLGGSTTAGVAASQLPPAHAGILVAWDSVSPEAIAAMVERTTERIHSLTKPIPADTVRLMKRELIRGISVGANPRETARRIIKRTEGQFNGGLNRALVIARTETLDSFRAGALASAKKNTDILNGWRWSCSLSGRTCGACLSMHGQEFPVDAPGPEGHPSCRCARVDITRSWADLGFDIPEPEDTFPDAREWYEGLTPDSQADILGKSRRDLLASGDIKWEDLATRKQNPGWRPSYQETPLKDLVKAE